MASSPCLDSLGVCLPLLRRELCDVGLSFVRRCRWLLHFAVDTIFLTVALKLLAKHLDLSDQLIGAGLDGHAGTVEAEGEDGALALHACEACGELDLPRSLSTPDQVTRKLLVGLTKL